MNNNVKPIIGCEIPVKGPTAYHTDAYHLVLLAENMEGYKNLNKLSSIVNSKGLRNIQSIEHSTLKKLSKGTIALSGCIHGKIPNLILMNKIDEAEKIAQCYKKIFGDENFYLEVQASGRPSQNKVNKALSAAT